MSQWKYSGLGKPTSEPCLHWTPSLPHHPQEATSCSWLPDHVQTFTPWYFRAPEAPQSSDKADSDPEQHCRMAGAQNIHSHNWRRSTKEPPAFGVTLSKAGMPDGISLVWEMNALICVCCLCALGTASAISGCYLKYFPAAVASSAAVAVRDSVKLRCSFCQQDPITWLPGCVQCDSPSFCLCRLRQCQEIVTNKFSNQAIR